MRRKIQNEGGCLILLHLSIKLQGDISPITPNDTPISSLTFICLKYYLITLAKTTSLRWYLQQRWGTRKNRPLEKKHIKRLACWRAGAGEAEGKTLELV